jgi:hypothetical protein
MERNSYIFSLMYTRLSRPSILAATLVAIALVASACSGVGNAPASVPQETTALVNSVNATVVSPEVQPDAPSMCVRLPTSNAADDLVANTYRFSPNPGVELPEDPDWSENPLDSNNWLFQYHTLRWARSLLVRWQETGDDAYFDRFEFLLSDWYKDNPREDPPSSFSWNDHSTAWRAMVFACASEFITEPWMGEALVLHGTTLADPDFYVKRGNHAFNQSIGLLAIGCRLENEGWIDLATERIETLVTDSLDSQGVTNEQAVEYQLYNRQLYSGASDWFAACDLEEPSILGRVNDMDEFLGFATMPNGEYVMIGDTGGRPAASYQSSITEFAASGGKSGTAPDSTSALFDAGFFFTRTGWGEDRAFADEVFMSVRFGPPRAFHGHFDGGSLTLYGYGTRLLIDPGKFTYNADELRTYFVGPQAHNVVLVEGATYPENETTNLTQVIMNEDFDYLSLERPIGEGVDWEREIVFSRDGYVVVVDRVEQPGAATVNQLWHLVESSNPTIDGSLVKTNRDGGNLAIVQLVEPDDISLIEGSEDPVQGWVSYRFGDRIPAPVVVSSMTGDRVTFVTLLAPSPNGETPEVLSFDLGDETVDLEFVYLGATNRVLISNGDVSIETAP